MTNNSNQPKHTQGEQFRANGRHIFDGKSTLIAECVKTTDPMAPQNNITKEEAEANAQRIVKAVNLLSFMEKQVSVDDGTITNDVIAQLLKQAEGK